MDSLMSHGHQPPQQSRVDFQLHERLDVADCSRGWMSPNGDRTESRAPGRQKPESGQRMRHQAFLTLVSIGDDKIPSAMQAPSIVSEDSL